jgi:hypothetical protein
MSKVVVIIKDCDGTFLVVENTTYGNQKSNLKKEEPKGSKNWVYKNEDEFFSSLSGRLNLALFDNTILTTGNSSIPINKKSDGSTRTDDEIRDVIFDKVTASIRPGVSQADTDAKKNSIHIVKNDDEISVRQTEGTFGFIQGGVEGKDANIKAAAIREVREEIGLDIPEADLYSIVADPGKSSSNNVFVYELPHGMKSTIKPSWLPNKRKTETMDIGFVTKSNLKDNGWKPLLRFERQSPDVLDNFGKNPIFTNLLGQGNGCQAARDAEAEKLRLAEEARLSEEAARKLIEDKYEVESKSIVDNFISSIKVPFMSSSQKQQKISDAKKDLGHVKSKIAELTSELIELYKQQLRKKEETNGKVYYLNEGVIKTKMEQLTTFKILEKLVEGTSGGGYIEKYQKYKLKYLQLKKLLESN